MKTHFKGYDDVFFFTVEAETKEDKEFLKHLQDHAEIELIVSEDEAEFKVYLTLIKCPLCGVATRKLYLYNGQRMCDACIMDEKVN